MPLHAQRERLHPAQHEIAVERRRHRAHRVLQEAHLVGELGVVRPRRSRRPRRSGHPDTSCSSAPRDPRPAPSGCWRNGVANVLSTTTRAWRACANLATASMSTIESAGFVGDSIHTRRVSSRHAASSAAGSRRSTAVHERPCRSCTRATSRNVPPYASVGMITWSPGSSVRRTASSAARPLANARPCRALLERRDARLERVSGRVGAAGVFVAAVLPDRFLRERRRQADRHARPRRSPRRAPAPRGSRAVSNLDRRAFLAHVVSSARRGTTARRSG